MSRNSQTNLVPRNGRKLEVCVVCRISGCQNQQEASLEDQKDNARQAVCELYDGPASFTEISTKGKGERLDRPELQQISEAYRSGRYDLFVFDDLSRLIRGGEAAKLLGIGVDNGTRTICINDGIDTADGTWEEDALNACSENVAHNERTSKRLKQKLRNRFLKYGGAMSRPIAGYVVPEEARTFTDWQKDPRFDLQSNPAADPWIHEGAKLLRETLNCTAVADMLNARNIPVGPYCRKKTWSGAMVRRYYANSLLKGQAVRTRMHSVKFHESGVRKSVRNPNGPVYYACPHLAYFEAEEFDELQQLLSARNAGYRRNRIGCVDPRANTPRKRTRFPGQHGRCWYCGYHHVWGGNGITENLMCSNARQRHCWNSVGYDGALAARKVLDALRDDLYQLDGFDEQYRELVERAGSGDRSEAARRWERLRQDESDLQKRRERFVEAIERYGVHPTLDAKLQEIEADERKVRFERRALERLGSERLEVPESTIVLRQMLEDEIAEAAYDSPEFGDLLRKLCPDFFVYLVRLCDGGHFLPRARIRLRLDGILPDAVAVPGLGEFLEREATLDLFELPQRERIRTNAVLWKEAGLGPKAIAARIAETSTERPTLTAVQNALALHNRMIEQGLSSPLITVLAPPDDYPKLRRHKNAKYRFQPLEGYVPLIV